MKIPNQAATAPASKSLLDRGLNQLDQVADRAIGGLNDLGQGFSSLLSQLTDSQTNTSTANKNAVQNSDPAMANNAEHNEKIAAGIAARTAIAAAKEEAKEGAKTELPVQPTEKAKADEPAKSALTTSNIQQQILSTLGLNFGDDQGLDSNDITSASSLDALQGALLSSLQANLFSTKAKQTDTSETASKQTQSSDIEAAALDDDSSLVDTITEFSFGENGLELTDAFDSVNILQHIPVVSGIYQQVTEQDMSAVAKLTGGFLYGGPLGLAVSAADLTLEGITGDSINSTVINFDYQGMLDGITESVLGSGVSQIASNNTGANSNKETTTTALSTAGLSSSVLEQIPQLARGAG